ncbi:hypothetical protein ElyMa_003557100 [Elysia marginata]|uniref:Uncharacterized protein n=1 Tax=Elysia marginata TaxID=1093978 RepID=A0AAV4EK05_9GAST|nr:hypothetical protein ElyMa_003557100 [Elysia marginata]
MEQSGTVDSVDKSSLLKKKRKSKDLDTGVDGNKQSHDGSQDFEVSGGFDEDHESEDIWERELPCDLRDAPEHSSPLLKEKTKLDILWKSLRA